MNITLMQLKNPFDGKYCFTHARGCITPDGTAYITMQPLRLTGSDVFYEMYTLISRDGGETWSEPKASKTLTRVPLADGIERVLCDATPLYHRATGKILLIGHEAQYQNDNLAPEPRKRSTMYTTWNEDAQDWYPAKFLEMPGDEDYYYSSGAGCAQYLELPSGELLLPIYFNDKARVSDSWHSCSSVTVLRCAFDGQELRVLETGDELTVPVPRGLGEPSIAAHDGRYFLCLRNDVTGYVTVGDGLHFEKPRELCFDDGTNLGNYNTQQHWLRVGGKLYLVYTRRAENNGHVFRHRAPLFLAEFDTERMCVVRETERIAVPERGARLGNFGCAQISDFTGKGDEAWVIAVEWMQSPRGLAGCMEHGSDNSLFIAKASGADAK